MPGFPTFPVGPAVTVLPAEELADADGVTAVCGVAAGVAVGKEVGCVAGSITLPLGLLVGAGNGVADCAPLLAGAVAAD